jgi:TolA-binding protein
MKTRVLTKIVAVGMVTGGLVTAGAFPLPAQETAPQQKGVGEPTQQPGMMGDRHKHHEQMEQMHREMSQELQKQLTALQEHTKVLEGISDEKQALTEMKKHLQISTV